MARILAACLLMACLAAGAAAPAGAEPPPAWGPSPWAAPPGWGPPPWGGPWHPGWAPPPWAGPWSGPWMWTWPPEGWWPGPWWRGPVTASQVRLLLQQWLAWSGNPRLKVGRVEERDGRILAEIVTRDGAVVDRFLVDPETGAWRRDTR